jgi:hypothetical protein
LASAARIDSQFVFFDVSPEGAIGVSVLNVSKTAPRTIRVLSQAIADLTPGVYLLT